MDGPFKKLVLDAFEKDNDGPLTEWKKFEDVPIMVITALGYFDRSMDSIKVLSKLLPVIRPHLPPNKYDLPFPGEKGVIMRCVLGNVCRGAPRIEGKKGWKHAIMIDISNDTKNLNCKISRSNIQITGSKKLEMVENGTLMVIDYINRINEWLHVFQSMKENNLPRITEILEEIFEDGKKNPEPDPYDRQLIQDWTVFGIKDNSDDTDEDKVVRNLCWYGLSDIRNQHNVLIFFNWLLRKAEPFTLPINMKGKDASMTKKRFNLNIPIDLNLLVEHLNPDFFRDYFSDVRNYSKVEIPCIHQKENKKRKHEIDKHTFNVESNGRITMSSSVYDEMEEIYYRFLYELFNIIDLIRTD